jgi:hypothetical protein
MSDIVTPSPKDHIIVEAMVNALVKIDSEKSQLEVLFLINDLLFNIFLIADKEKSSSGIIKELLAKKQLIASNDKIQLISNSLDEREAYYTSNFSRFLEIQANVELARPAMSEIEALLGLATNITSQKRYLNEEIGIFLNYLFNPKDMEVTDDQKLSLYLLLSEEYRKLLEKRDISTMVALGEKSVMMIVTRVYDRIDTDKTLKNISKGKLTTLMRKFFFVLKGAVDSLQPN